jgi:DNA-binding NarL/FixJ family response regulator
MTDRRVFIAEPDRDVRLGLEMYLDRKLGMRVVGIAVRSEGLVSQVGATQPDIVILDWGLIASAPESYIKNLHSIESQPHIVVVHIRPETRGAAEAAGADCFHSKDRGG